MKPIIAVSFQTEDSEKAYSIRHRWIDYVEAIGAAAVMLVPANDFSSTERVLSCASGVLIPGGNDVDPKMYGQKPLAGTDSPSPLRDKFESWLVKHCVSNNIPFLGICRGMQIANVALGGSLCQSIEDRAGEHIEHWRLDDATQPVHSIKLCEGGVLQKIFRTSTLEVNSVHHQSIDSVSALLEVSAISQDGLIEALTCPKCNFFVGVQWHPEFNADAKFSAALGKAFMEACLANTPFRV